MDNNKKYTFEVREIDSLHEGESWYWNSSYLVGYFQTSAKDEKRAFTRYLKKNGISFKLNRTIIDSQDGWNILEIQDRKTKEPLYAAIYREQF